MSSSYVDRFGGVSKSTLRPSQSQDKMQRVTSQPSARSSPTEHERTRRSTLPDDDIENAFDSDDPLLLTDKSSQPGSPAPAKTPSTNIAKSSAPSRSSSTRTISSSNRRYEDDDDMNDETPIAPRRGPLSNSNGVGSVKPEERQFPMQDLHEGKHLLQAEPASPELAPFPLDVAKIRKTATQDRVLEPEPFPLAHLAQKGKTKEAARDEPAPFPVPMPSSASSAVAPFPMAVPEKSASTTRIRNELPTADTNARAPKKTSTSTSSSEPTLRPFPMAGVARRPLAKESSKRPNEDDDSDRASKRRKRSEEADGDSSFDADLDAPIDPSLLCQFCDELLPAKVSATYKELLRHALKHAHPTPRRANIKAMRAPMTAYISVCERHRFEAKILPQAISAGWPTEIDFDMLPARVQDSPVRKMLDGVLADPRMSSFFMEAVENIVKVGARVAESAMGQYATFENIQPGYYGERGSVVLHQALFALYPPEVLNTAQSRYAPLSTQTFIHSVLVPEAALALIMQDTRSSRPDALKTMRASSRYGSLMFPDDDEADGAGEALMRARARQRRKEIEQEEANEKRLELEAAKNPVQPMEVEESDASVVSTRTRSKTARAKAPADESDAASTTSTRRAKAKSRSKAAVSDVDDTDEPKSSASTASRRDSKKISRRAKSAAVDDVPTPTTPSQSMTPKKKPAYLEVNYEDEDEDVQRTVTKPPRPRATSSQPIDMTSDASEDSGVRKGRGKAKAAPTSTVTDEESSDAHVVEVPPRPTGKKPRNTKKQDPTAIDLTSSAESASGSAWTESCDRSGSSMRASELRQLRQVPTASAPATEAAASETGTTAPAPGTAATPASAPSPAQKVNHNVHYPPPGLGQQGMHMAPPPYATIPGVQYYMPYYTYPPGAPGQAIPGYPHPIAFVQPKTSPGSPSAGTSAQALPSPEDKPKKSLVIACYSCREKKLRCDMARPACTNCATRRLTCGYRESVRRRGPGKRKRAAQAAAVGSDPVEGAGTSAVTGQPTVTGVPVSDLVSQYAPHVVHAYVYQTSSDGQPAVVQAPAPPHDASQPPPTNAEGAAPVTPAPVKRGRGRPKGSTNKKSKVDAPAVAPEDEDAPYDEEDPDETDGYEDADSGDDYGTPKRKRKGGGGSAARRRYTRRERSKT